MSKNDDPTTDPYVRIRFRPFAARRARKAEAKAAEVEQRAWWHQRWSDAMRLARKTNEGRTPVRRRRLERDLDRHDVAYLRLPGSKLMVPVGHMTPEGPAVASSAFVHEHTHAVQTPTGRWGKGEPYRNPDRAAKLARSGRLRKELQ